MLPCRPKVLKNELMLTVHSWRFLQVEEVEGVRIRLPTHRNPMLHRNRNFDPKSNPYPNPNPPSSQVALPELDGGLEPIVFAGRDSATGKSHSLPDRIASLTSRAIKWAQVRSMRRFAFAAMHWYRSLTLGSHAVRAHFSSANVAVLYACTLRSTIEPVMLGFVVASGLNNCLGPSGYEQCSVLTSSNSCGILEPRACVI